MTAARPEFAHAKRVASGTFTDWFDLGKYAGAKLHGRLQRAGVSPSFQTSRPTSSPVRTARPGKW
jgi:hypothetical protein